MFGRLVAWMGGLRVGWLVGWLFGSCLVVRLRFVSLLERLVVGCSVAWLAGCLRPWMVGR